MRIYGLFLLVCVFILSGCGGGGGTQNVSVVSIGDDALSQPVILQLDNETMTLTGWDTSGPIVDKLSAMAKVSVENSSDITFDVEADSTVDTGEIGTRAWNVSKYRCMIRWEKGWVRGCIQRYGWHLNLHIQDRAAGREVFNAHLISWRQNGPQFGVYNSANNVCRTSRGTFTAVRQAIRDVIAKSTPLPSWAVSSIAYSSAVICFGTLAFLAI